LTSRRGLMLSRHVSLTLLAGVGLALASCDSSAGPGSSLTDAPATPWSGLHGLCSGTTRTQFPEGSRLDGVAVTGRCSAWAVGSYLSGLSALIERWNGFAWHQVRAPGPHASTSLFAVAAASANDVWAVGIQHDVSERHARTLIDHWNGQLWKVVPSPNPRGSFSTAVLTSVSAGSRGDVWAAGYYEVGDLYRTLIEHWNGTEWRIVSSPNRSASEISSVLAGISVAPQGQAWAVGYYSKGAASWSLVEHWDGRGWRIAPGPDSRQSGLESVTARSPTGTWAVGWSHRGTSNQPEIARWDGSSWHLVPCPHLAGHGSAELVDVDGVGSSAVAVGFYYQGPSSSMGIALAWHGNSWTAVTVPAEGPGNADVSLGSVGGLEFGRPWIVGFMDLGSAEQAIAIRP
jgi:hypothetical protein